MVALFHDMIHREVEVYVDDILAKSMIKEDHVQILRKLLERLRKYQLKLSLAKDGKIIGY